MISELIAEYNKLQQIDISQVDEECLKESIYGLLLCVHRYKLENPEVDCIDILQEIALGCHRKLRELNNQIVCTMEHCDFYYCNLTELLENLTAACDLILSGSGKRIVFEAPKKEVYQVCAPELVILMVLNLLSSACLNPIRTVFKLSLSIGENNTIISITAPFYDKKCFSKTENGTLAVRTGARLHGGSLVFYNQPNCCRAAFSIPFGIQATTAQEYAVCDFIEYICDRLSPVYTSLCDFCLSPL